MHPTQRTEVVMAAAQLGAVAEVATEVLPQLTRATHSAMVFLYEASASGVVIHGPDGASDLVQTYFRDFVRECPLHQIKEEADGQLISTTRIAAERGFAKSTVYRGFFRPNELDHHLAVRLLPENTEHGELGLMLNRSARQGEFSEQDVTDVGFLVPSLAAALRMGAKLDVARRRKLALEALLLDADEGTTRVIWDERARVVHIHSNEGAAEIAGIAATLADQNNPLLVACRVLLRDEAEVPVQLVHELTTSSRSVYRAELSVTNLVGRERAVVATLVRSACPPEAWATWGLSRAETTILRELVAGHSNVEIGKTLFISPETVRTHLTRIFKKLGVRSRLEAALLASRAGARFQPRP